jgi:mono/diheme cytochrome c family protein
MKIILFPIIILSVCQLLTSFQVVKNTQQNSKPASGQSGPELFKTYCLSCHQADGNGVRGMYPPLAGNEVVTGPSEKVITIVLFGLEGPIEVNGREYNQLMPSQDYLSDKQVADVLTYVRNSWGNKADQIKPEQVNKIRKMGKKP